MIKKISTLVIGSLSVVALASGCAVDAMDTPAEELGTEEQAAQVCSNDQATNAIIASMAVAMGREVRRWQPKTDLQFNYGTGMLELSGTGWGRCTNGCKVLSQLLAMQKPEAAGMYFGGAELSDPGVLRSRLWSYWDRQNICNNNPDQGRADQCPAESHELSNYRESTSGSTCAGSKDSWFKAKYAAGHPMAGQPLSAADAAQLRNTLKWAGEAPGTGGNQYLQFEQDPNVLGDVKIDPLDGTTGGDSSGSGTIEAAANPVWKATPAPGLWACDATNVNKTVGFPCTCNALNRTWQPKPLMSGWFVCK